MSGKSHFNCLKFSSILLFLLMFQFAGAQPKNKLQKEVGVDQYPELDGLVSRYQKTAGGDLVAMLWRDTLVYKRELGEFDSKAAAPVGPSSRWFTIALILQFVDEGKISLDDKITQYLPIFSDYGKNYITIRHCLTNFTGIQATGGGKLFGGKSPANLEELVNSYAKHEIQTNPGTEFRYSDLGINIAARIVEIVSKKKFDMLIRQRLFNPLGMRQSTFTKLDASAPDPASGAMASANDFMKFLSMLLHNGLANGQAILSEASVAEMKKIQTESNDVKSAPKSAEGLSYAIGGWVINGSGTEATALSYPGNATWPVVDWCHGYAFLLLTKKEQNEQKKETFIPFKESLDDRIHSTCK